MWPYPWTHVGTPSHLGHMDRVAATMPSQAHAGAAQEAPDIGQWEGQDVPLVRPSSCNVKGGIPSSRRYLPTYLAAGCWMFAAGWLLSATCLLMQGGTVLSRQVKVVSEEGSRKSGGGIMFGVFGVCGWGGGCLLAVFTGSVLLPKGGGGWLMCWLLAVGRWLLVVGRWRLAADCCCCLLFAVGCWLLAAGCWLVIVCCWLTRRECRWGSECMRWG